MGTKMSDKECAVIVLTIVAPFAFLAIMGIIALFMISSWMLNLTLVILGLAGIAALGYGVGRDSNV